MIYPIMVYEKLHDLASYKQQAPWSSSPYKFDTVLDNTLTRLKESNENTMSIDRATRASGFNKSHYGITEKGNLRKDQNLSRYNETLVTNNQNIVDEIIPHAVQDDVTEYMVLWYE